MANGRGARRPGRRVAERLEPTATLLVGAVVVGLTYWRLYLGVDFTDESFYVAVPYRFVRGAHVFVTENAVAQGFVGILLYPFVKAYYELVGLTGIVLFVRHLHFLFSLGVAAVVALSLRPVLETSRAVLVGLTAVAFVPFNIHSLSYNTLGSGLFGAGCFLAFQGVREPERRLVRVLAGLSLGLAVFAYQPLAIAVAAVCAAGVAFTPRGRRRALLAYETPALLLPLAVAAALVGSAGLETFRADVRARSSIDDSVGRRLYDLAVHEVNSLRHGTLLLILLVLLVVVTGMRRALVAPIVLALPLLVLPPGSVSIYSSLEYVAHLAWLAPFLFPIVRERQGAKHLLGIVWLPGLVGGIVTGVSSSNGGVNAAIGALPAALASAVFLIWALSETLPRRLAGLAGLPVVVGIGFLLLFEAIPSYRDASITHLTARIHRGAFAGLSTTRANRDLVRDLRSDLAGIDGSCSIVFLDFPAGYLLTRAIPQTTSAWKASHDALLRSYRERGFPDVAVIMHPATWPSSDALVAALTSTPYRLTSDRTSYAVYRRGSSCPRTAAVAERTEAGQEGRLVAFSVNCDSREPTRPDERLLVRRDRSASNELVASELTARPMTGF